MKTFFIVRLSNSPVFFPPHGGRHMLVPSDKEASRFSTKEDAIYALQRRGIGFKGVTILEVPNGSAQSQEVKNT
jgi:hypothetical protein